MAAFQGENKDFYSIAQKTAKKEKIRRKKHGTNLSGNIWKRDRINDAQVEGNACHN